MLRIIRPAILLACVVAPLAAQQQGSPSSAAKKPALTMADYAKWETLGSGALSPDGKWVAYDFRRGNGSNELRYRDLASNTEHTVRSANAPQFTSNGRWLLYTVLPDTAAGRGGRGGAGRGGAGGAAAMPANRNKVAAIDVR
jgi:hypothetical protein